MGSVEAVKFLSPHSRRQGSETRLFFQESRRWGFDEAVKLFCLPILGETDWLSPVYLTNFPLLGRDLVFALVRWSVRTERSFVGW